MKFGEEGTKFGGAEYVDDKKEEASARKRYASILDQAIAPITTVYVSYGEELQSYLMWYAIMDGYVVKRTKGESYAE